MESLQDRNVFFVGDNFYGMPDYALKLANALESQGIDYFIQTTVNAADNPKFLEALEKSGCKGILVGFESTEQSALAGASKGQYKSSDYPAQIKRFHDHGLWIYGSFVVGFDTDTVATFAAIYEFCQANKIEFPVVPILTPDPGTAMFRHMESRIIQPVDWDKFDRNHVVYNPANMSAEELSAGTDELKRKLYSKTATAERMEQAQLPAKLTFSNLALALNYSMCRLMAGNW